MKRLDRVFVLFARTDDEKLHRQVKAQAALEGRKMEELIVEAVRTYLAKKGMK